MTERYGRAFMPVTADMRAYFLRLMEEREAEPRDDLATLVVQAEIDGEPIDRELQYGYLLLLILAGIDTRWSAIGSGLWHLGSHPADLERVRDKPFGDPIRLTFSEEVLRHDAPVTMGRRVVGDASVSGCPVHAGDQVLVTFPAANHDLDVFDRFEPRPARDEIAFQEWASAFPDDRLDPE